MSPTGVARRAYLLSLLMLLVPLTLLVSADSTNWSGPPNVQVSSNGGVTTVDGFEIPTGQTITDAWLEVSEDGMTNVGIGSHWIADQPQARNFSWGSEDNTTLRFFDGSLSLDANHSVGRINDFETLTRTLQNWNFGGTPEIWEVSDMVGLPGVVNGSGRESSGGLIPLGAVDGRYIVATKAGQALPNGVHSWMESPDFGLPRTVRNLNLTFMHWQHMYTPSQTNGAADGAWVEMSLDHGQTWFYITPDNGYNNRINPTAPAPNGTAGSNFPVWASPNASGWQQATFNLDHIQGINNATHARWRWVVWTDVNSTVQRPGWFIDRVNLTNVGTDAGTWFHGNLNGEYSRLAESQLVLTTNLSNASGPIMLNYATDFDMEGDIYDNFRWDWSIDNSTWNAISANMPGYGVLINGQVFVDDSRGWQQLSHPLPASLAGNNTVYLRVYVRTDAMPGTGYGGQTIDPPEGVFIDEVNVVSGTIGNETTHLSLNFTSPNDGNPWHSWIGSGVNDWQHLTSHGFDGPTHIADSFENSPLLPTGWEIDTVRGNGWMFYEHNNTWLYGPDAPTNGSYYAGIGFGNQYSANTWTHLISPDLLIPSGSHALVSFKSFICAEMLWDGGILSISTDNGRTWTPYGSNTYDFYDTQQMMNPNSDIYNLWAFDGSNAKPTCDGQRGGNVNKSWVTKQTDVSQFAGQAIRLRFSFYSDALVESDGWYLDDVGIYVDWFESVGTWTSQPINTSRGGLGTFDIAAEVPNGTQIWGQLLDLNETNIIHNGTFPLTPSPNLPEQVKMRLVLATDSPELTPKVHAMSMGGVRVFSAKDTTNGWTLSPALNINQTSGNITNPTLSTQSIISGLTYANAPMQAFMVSGHAAGTLLTLTDQRGSPIHNGALVNGTVQAPTPVAAYQVRLDLQPGGWLNMMGIFAFQLDPADNVSIDVGVDGTSDWQFPNSAGTNRLGWQDGWRSGQANVTDLLRGWSYDGNLGPVTNHFLIPDGAVVTGGLFAIEIPPQIEGGEGTIRDISVAGVSIQSTRNLSDSESLLIPLNGNALQSVNALQPSWSLAGLNQRQWREVPVTVDFTHNVSPQNYHYQFSLLGLNYELTENVTGLGPVVAQAMNNTPPQNDTHSIPVSVAADAGGVGLWGGVSHSPLMTSTIVSSPQVMSPDRPFTITTRHTHLFEAGEIVRANLTFISQGGDTIHFSATDLISGGTFSQSLGGGQVVLDTSASAVTGISQGWEIEWVFRTLWTWNDVAWLDLTPRCWDSTGVTLPSESSRIGGGPNAVENDMEIDSWEVRSLDNRLLSERTSPSYPFEVAAGGTVEVSGTVRFQDASNLRPSGDDFLVAIQVTGIGEPFQVPAVSGVDGHWNLTLQLPDDDGSIDLSAWILRVGPTDVSRTDALDMTQDRTEVSLVLDGNAPTLGELMAHTPSGLRRADGNVWPPERPLPLSIEITEAEALGASLYLMYWRSSIDDWNNNGLPDAAEYNEVREVTPIKVNGTVRIDFRAIDLFGNEEGGLISLYVRGSDLAGHPVIGGGSAGFDSDLATITTEQDQPTSLSLPTLQLDRTGEQLLLGRTHRFSFTLLDGNGIDSLDNITLRLSHDDSRGDIWLDPSSRTLSTHANSPVFPVNAEISALGDGAYEVDIDFRIGADAPQFWVEAPQIPSLEVVEHGQVLQLGSERLNHLAWTLDSRLELSLVDASDLSSPISQMQDGTLYLQPSDRFNFTGQLRHRADGGLAILDGDDWSVLIQIDDDEENPLEWISALTNGSDFGDSVEMNSARWSGDYATLTASIIGSAQSLDIEPMTLEIVLDSSAPVIEFPPTTLSMVESNRLSGLLVTVQVYEDGGMPESSLELHWSFRRHGVEMLDMYGTEQLEYATSTGRRWTYSSYVDFDIDHTLLRPDDQLVIWVSGSDLAGHPLVGHGVEDDPRSPLLRVIYFHPVISDVYVIPETPVVDDLLSIDLRVTNHGNLHGSAKIGLWTWQDSGTSGRYVLLNESNVTLLPQQHQLVHFEISAWSTGDLQLYLTIDDDQDNLTSVPVNQVRTTTATEQLLSGLTSPAALGLLILILAIVVMGVAAFNSERDDDWEEEVPPPPPWAPDEWPDGAGPPPEILTSAEISHEEE